jgi:isopenicillin-N epimerase
MSEPDLAAHWTLDPSVTFLNHGSFGACPKVVLEAQSELRARLERQPVQFFVKELEPLLDAARAELAAFVGANADDLAFVPNATTGVNTVLRSLRLRPGDELLVTDHEYNACRNALDHAAERSGARIVVAPVPFPLTSGEQVVDAMLAKAGKATRLALFDHVTSPTGIVMPANDLVARLQERGIDCLVDGAHAPGMLPLDLGRLGAAYYTGNCHKWLCAPKGAALLHVRADCQQQIRPLAISHGANSPRTDRSRFRLEFDWAGTGDPTPYLCVPAALRFLRGLLPGGIDALRARNRSLVLEARALLCDTLRTPPPVPAAQIGSLATVILPPEPGPPPKSPLYADPLHDALLARFAIEVPVLFWPALGKRMLRVSAQAYNRREQYEKLCAALRELLSL